MYGCLFDFGWIECVVDYYCEVFVWCWVSVLLMWVVSFELCCVCVVIVCVSMCCGLIICMCVWVCVMVV